MPLPGRRIRRLAAVALLLTSVAACQTSPPRAAGEPAVATPAVAPEQPIRPTSARRTPSQNILRATPATDAAKATASPAPERDAEALMRRHFAALGEPVFDDPAALKGRKAESVTAILGDPDLLRRDAPAELWQYAGDSCVLTVILYRKGDGMAVEHVETRDRAKGTPVAGPGCLRAVLAERLAAS